MKNSDNQPILIAKALHKSYTQGGRTIPVIKGISLEIAPGSSHAIVGASGSGKSTLLHLLSGLDHPTDGSVTYQGVELHRQRPRQQEEFRRHEIGFMFQFHYLIQELTVEENCRLPLELAKIPSDEARARTDAMLERLGLSHRQTAYPWQLSGGEQQRVALARAMITRPRLVYADEPTGNLDSSNRDLLVTLIREEQDARGLTIVLCSHDPAVYRRMDRCWKLVDGCLTPFEE